MQKNSCLFQSKYVPHFYSFFHCQNNICFTTVFKVPYVRQYPLLSEFQNLDTGSISKCTSLVKDLRKCLAILKKSLHTSEYIIKLCIPNAMVPPQVELIESALQSSAVASFVFCWLFSKCSQQICVNCIMLVSLFCFVFWWFTMVCISFCYNWRSK